METKLDGVIKSISKAVLAALIAIGGVMLVVTWIHVFCRYFLGSALTWSEEFLKISLVWFGLLSVSMIAQERAHISVVIFKDHMPKKLAQACGIVSEILLLIASAAVFAIGVWLVYKTRSQLTPALRWPIGIGYSAIPFSFLLMTFYEMRNLVVDFKALGANRLAGNEKQ